MIKQTALRQKIYEVEYFVDLGTIGEEYFRDGMYLYDRFESNNFSPEDLSTLARSFRELADKLQRVAEDIDPR